MKRRHRWVRFFITALALLGAGCDQSMIEQNKYTSYAPAPQFPNDASARPLVKGVVAIDADLTSIPDQIPEPITLELMQRGQAQYNIYCVPCHGLLGNGLGILPEYGFPQPPSYTKAELLKAPDKHFFHVITHGKDKMYSYADRIEPRDRWAIVAYIRALQLSQQAKPSDLPPGVTLAGETSSTTTTPPGKSQ
jgi:mono/diheme cytochrome c family protein